jgi:hypothetical protein
LVVVVFFFVVAGRDAVFLTGRFVVVLVSFEVVTGVFFLVVVDVVRIFGFVVVVVRFVDVFAGTAATLLVAVSVVDPRTSRIAFVCSASVIRNSWCPSGLATKYRYGTFAGFAAAARLAAPGAPIGPGGSPLLR